MPTRLPSLSVNETYCPHTRDAHRLAEHVAARTSHFLDVIDSDRCDNNGLRQIMQQNAESSKSSV